MRDFMKGVTKFLGGLLVLALVVGGVLYGFFIRVVDVGHNAMAPTILAGDRILIWRGTDYELGDAVLCPHPAEPGRFVLGRIVGRPGQTISIQSGVLRISGDSPDVDLHGAIEFVDTVTGRTTRMIWADVDLLDHDHRIFYRAQGSAPELRERLVEGGYYLLSDNRSQPGEDSRAFGVVDGDTCLGTVFMRLTAAEGPPEIGNKSFELLD